MRARVVFFSSSPFNSCLLLVGFGYEFRSVAAAAGVPRREEEVDELARAFGLIFSTARQFRALTILQVWFPVLRRFVSCSPLHIYMCVCLMITFGRERIAWWKKKRWPR